MVMVVIVMVVMVWLWCSRDAYCGGCDVSTYTMVMTLERSKRENSATKNEKQKQK